MKLNRNDKSDSYTSLYELMLKQYLLRMESIQNIPSSIVVQYRERVIPPFFESSKTMSIFVSCKIVKTKRDVRY